MRGGEDAVGVEVQGGLNGVEDLELDAVGAGEVEGRGVCVGGPAVEVRVCAPGVGGDVQVDR